MIGVVIKLKSLNSNIKFSIEDFPQKLFIDNIFDPHLKLKRNVFNNCVLDLSGSGGVHNLIFKKNLKEITYYTKWELWVIIQVLLTFIPTTENTNLKNPIIDGGNSIYYSQSEDIVYQYCQIDNYKFSYITIDFIENDLCKILDKITLKSTIKFITYKGDENVSLMKFRYIGLNWEELEYYDFLTKSLVLNYN